MKTYTVEVWYRFVVNGEQEKEFNIHEIQAENSIVAMKKAKDLYKSHTAIPFRITIKN